MADSKLKRDLKQWADNKRRPLVLVAVGRGGAGKSTLVNNLLELEEGDEQYWSVGNLACAKTKDVEVRTKQKEGVEIHIADTPGLGASVDKIDPGKVIKDISKKTEKKADILFYCISLHPSARPCSTDVKIVKLLTAAYGAEIWERAFLILTFANQCTEQGDYVTRINSYASTFSDVLKSANVNLPVRPVLPGAQEAPQLQDSLDPAGQVSVFIPAIPVGGKDPDLPLPCQHNWSEKLVLEVLKKASDPHTLANLLALRGFKIKLEEVVGGAVGGAAVGGAVGGTAGAVVGLGFGVIIGTPVGAAAGGISGAVVAIAKAKLLKFLVTNF